MAIIGIVLPLQTPAHSKAHIPESLKNLLNPQVQSKPSFPDMANNYQATVAVPQQQAAQAAEAAEDAQAALEATQVTQAAQPVSYAPTALQVVTDALTGSEGYSLPYGNCVDEPGVNDPFNGTNPISWIATSNVPWIGASALFTFNHVAVVSGIWSNGDIEVRQRNCPGCSHRFPLSTFRGFR